jgi:hypothetical protein
MEEVKKLPKSFFTKVRPIAKGKEKSSYSKIEEIKWNKDILQGKNKVIGTISKKV